MFLTEAFCSSTFIAPIIQFLQSETASTRRNEEGRTGERYCGSPGPQPWTPPPPPPPHWLCPPGAASSTQATLCPFNLGTSSPTSEPLTPMIHDAFRQGSRRVSAAAPASICSGAAKLDLPFYWLFPLQIKWAKSPSVSGNLQLTKLSQALKVLAFYIKFLAGKPDSKVWWRLFVWLVLVWSWKRPVASRKSELFHVFCSDFLK